MGGREGRLRKLAVKGIETEIKGRKIMKIDIGKRVPYCLMYYGRRKGVEKE